MTMTTTMITDMNMHMETKKLQLKMYCTTLLKKNLTNVTQLTFGGDNAEAYFSFDDEMIVFQSNNPAWSLECDQIFYTKLDGANMQEKKCHH